MILFVMHQILFHFPDSWPIIGGANLYSYGLMLGLAFITGWHLGLHFALKEGIPAKTATNTKMATSTFNFLRKFTCYHLLLFLMCLFPLTRIIFHQSVYWSENPARRPR